QCEPECIISKRSLTDNELANKINLKCGDIVKFERIDSQLIQYYHAGLYVGDGNVIHIASREDAKVKTGEFVITETAASNAFMNGMFGGVLTGAIGAAVGFCIAGIPAGILPGICLGLDPGAAATTTVGQLQGISRKEKRARHDNEPCKTLGKKCFKKTNRKHIIIITVQLSLQSL
ncbi:unnamed protein product, partial [Didymodactylos carnosus]